jgi:DNA-binding CsgD family transcriptional regulator
MRLNELDQAKQHFEEALAIFQRTGETAQSPFALGGLGDIARLQGNFPQASSYLRDALTKYRYIGNKLDVIFVLEALAILSEALGQHERSACLWGATEAHREATHLYQAPSYQQDYAAYINKAREALGERPFAAAWEQGRRLTLEEAIDLGLSSTAQTDSPAASNPPNGHNPWFDLTPREMEVLRLLATGLTDSQIGAQLFLSRRTVSTHLQSIYRKIQVSSRSAATRFAFDHKLA